MNNASDMGNETLNINLDVVFEKCKTLLFWFPYETVSIDVGLTTAVVHTHDAVS